ncbi:hypothetical protein QBC47DRAFT_391563 [Echria macrotheca]|uniref:Uncharacterized protein n=1 Tax=Echria macrotheca TaxID=438768 RepID=A0AAJ0B411_9PEZI|nr:hypothetical protein QBC47DRAFT_391563 [Echria macrotheca]
MDFRDDSMDIDKGEEVITATPMTPVSSKSLPLVESEVTVGQFTSVVQAPGYRIVRGSQEIKTLPDVFPKAWECCHCGAISQMQDPGYHHLGPVTLDDFPDPNPDGAASRHRKGKGKNDRSKSKKTCSNCKRRRCVFCEVLSIWDHRVICSLGGKNLADDRLTPNGWQCCVCNLQHHPMARYRPDLYVYMPSMRKTSDGTTTNKCFLPYRCAHDIKRSLIKIEDPAPHLSDAPPHQVCFKCQIVNRYGEVIGRVDPDTIILDDKPGPLRDNLIYAQVQRQWMQDRLSHQPPAEEGGSDKLPSSLEEAAQEIEEARARVKDAKAWVAELRRGIRATAAAAASAVKQSTGEDITMTDAPTGYPLDGPQTSARSIPATPAITGSQFTAINKPVRPLKTYGRSKY